MSLLGLMMVLFLFFSSRFGAGILKEEANKYLRSFTGASLIFNCVYGCYNLNQYLMSEENIISLALGTNITFFCFVGWLTCLFSSGIGFLSFQFVVAAHHILVDKMLGSNYYQKNIWFISGADTRRRTPETRCEEANHEF